MTKKVLVVGMLNSIHTAKWLSQFKDEDLDIRIFPSTYFKKLHPVLEDLLSQNSICSYSISGPMKIVGFLDYIMNRFLSKSFELFQRVNRLHNAIDKFKPSVVHALEFQHAGYLCLEVIENHGKDFELISTNWGSDIYHFKDFPIHQEKIRRLLALSDMYSSECDRDVDLALGFGFAGKLLPVFPNSGGFPLEDILRPRKLTSTRKLVLVKAYGGYFGRAKLVIELVPQILDAFPDLSFYFYSVTPDLESLVNGLCRNYPGKIEFSTVSKPLTYSALQSLFDEARVYVGCSISDGISTSFLEALVAGAYPIQTSTSCANEWINKGAIATLVGLDSQQILEGIVKAVSENHYLDLVQSTNKKVALEFLDSTKISELSKTFY